MTVVVTTKIRDCCASLMANCAKTVSRGNLHFISFCPKFLISEISKHAHQVILEYSFIIINFIQFHNDFSLNGTLSMWRNIGAIGALFLGQFYHFKTTHSLYSTTTQTQNQCFVDLKSCISAKSILLVILLNMLLELKLKTKSLKMKINKDFQFKHT